MNILLVKPRPDSSQFGLAPFFQTEPLGLEYIARALEGRGHRTTIVDLRFERRRFPAILRALRPRVIGIACLHILDSSATLRLADEIKRFNPEIIVLVGGHAASAYPEALRRSSSIDAICIGEGEALVPDFCDAVEGGRPLSELPSLLLRSEAGCFESTSNDRKTLDLATVTPPDRSKITGYQRHYCCLNYMPVWTIETTRGCPHRCKFCSVWQFYKGSCRFHTPAHVRADFEAVGKNLFVIDDIFWADRSQSEDLARTLLKSHERKNWTLVQSRTDLVAQNPDLLALWRPLSKAFDIFFGFESPTGNGLQSLNKGTDVADTVNAVNLARELGFGVTGNFIIDPGFTEEDFAELWAFLDEHRLHRVGFTILTPLPGTYYFEQAKSGIEVFDWNQYDLHHLLWQPRLPVERFFELYCETWRRSVLNLAGSKKWWTWTREAGLFQIPRLMRILWRTQRLMAPSAYLADMSVSPPGEQPRAVIAADERR